MEHFAFPGNIDFAADDQGAFSCIIHEQFAIQMTQNCKHSKWLQILAEEDFSLKLLWRLRQWKFIGERIEEDNCEAERTSLSTAKATSSTQRPQTCTEAATKYYNYIVNETDEEREHRLPTLTKAAGLKCTSQVTGQVTGYRPQVRSQATGHRPKVRSQVTQKTIGHWTKLDWRFTIQK